jgi:hypothetical protein
MIVGRESELRMALRHVKTGQGCIVRQHHVIGTLRDKGLPTEQAEIVLEWLEEAQRGFEDHYKKVLSGKFVAIQCVQDSSPDIRDPAWGRSRMNSQRPSLAIPGHKNER